MATEAGELIVKISADVAEIKTAMKEMSDGMQRVGADTVAKGTLMADAFKEVGMMAVKFATDSIKAFGEQEATMIRLNHLVGSDTANAFEELSNQMQKTTNYSDNEVLALEAQLTMFGLMPDQVKAATGTLIDFASATGKTLPEAGSIMGQALAGRGRELKQFGVEVFQTDTRSERFTKTINGLTSEFNGMASELHAGTLGALTGMQNSFEQLEQSVGKFLSSPGVGFTRWITGFIDNVTESVKTITDFVQQLGGMGKMFQAVFIEMGRQVLDFLTWYIDKMSALGPILKLVGVNIDGIRKSLNAKLDTMQKDIQTTQKSTTVTVQGEKQKVKAINDTKQALDQYMSQLNQSLRQAQMVYANIEQISAIETQKKILNSKIAFEQMKSDEIHLTEITQQETEKRLMESQLAWETNASFSDQLKVKLTNDMDQNTSAWVNMTTSMMDSFYAGTAKMIVEGGRFKDVLTSIWKSLAEAVIAQIMRMIAEWLIFQAMTGGAGGGLGAVLGGWADGGMINEPSIITGMRSGKSYLAGEAGPEMVVPAGAGGGGGSSNRPLQGGEGGGAGGSGVTINISGQFLEGSAAKWQKIVREQIVPQIRRFTMSTPVGPFNRKRGAS